MGKVAIVGVEGSGKTVLMAGLCECYKQSTSSDLYLMPENKAAHMFMTQVPHKLRVKREWPAATNIDGLRTMKWTLRRGQTVVEEIEMLDYPGELYRLAFDDDARPAEIEAKRPELNEFLGHLTDAEVLVVLLNLANLENPGENAKNAETIWLTRKIFDYAMRLPNIERMMLVFTQADRYANQLETAGGPQALYARDLPMMHILYPRLSVTSVSAVGAVDDENRPLDGFSSKNCVDLMDLILNRSTTNIRPGCEKKLDIGNDVIMTFVWCPPGKSSMGSPVSEESRNDDEKLCSVEISKGFFIGKYPVTQRQFEVIMRYNPSTHKSGKFLGLGGATQQNHPVDSVSFIDATNFVDKLNTRYRNGVFRLPSEALWEYACRAGTETPYAGDLHCMAWYAANSGNTTHAVGQKAPNAWGVHDMHGNVWEWCEDYYFKDYFDKSRALNNGGAWGVTRGGSFGSTKEACRSAVRQKWNHTYVSDRTGFRLVLTME